MAAGTWDTRAMTISASDLAAVRGEVGSTPDDATIADMWTSYGNVPAVALAVLRPRLADALAAAASGSLTIPGAISVGAPAQPTMLREQIQRLEIALQASTGDADPTMMIGTSQLRRRSQTRGLSILP